MSLTAFVIFDRTQAAQLERGTHRHGRLRLEEGLGRHKNVEE